MASKYDLYWMARLEEIGVAVRAAADGTGSPVDVTGVRGLGNRRSWYGIAEVHGREMTRSSMAHAASLGRAVAASGMCAAWPDRTFRFTVSTSGVLTVTTADHGGRPRRASLPERSAAPRMPSVTASAAPTEQWPGAGSPGDSQRGDTTRFYLLLNALAGRVGGTRLLRDCTGAQNWPRHGVYFFFEDGEQRADGSRRVVRVGTHALTPTSRRRGLRPWLRDDRHHKLQSAARTRGRR